MGILRVLVVGSKREVYTARLSFIWIVKERGGDGGEVEFLTTLCVLCTIVLGVRGGGINWSLGLGKISGLPPK